MSVVVKGMRMPDSCAVCRFAGKGGYRMERVVCMFTGKNEDAGIVDRLSDCPLVDLGKHGKLIDADALEPDADYDDGEFWAYSVTQVCDEPAVIEAEEGT